MDEGQPASKLGPATGFGFTAAAERPRSQPDLFSFEFWSPRASFGGHIALWRWPAQQLAWYSTAVFRQGELVVALADEVPLGKTLELRGNGLWADHNLEQPFEHWSIGLEAFALALDHPAADRGDRVPLGYELDWELDPGVLNPIDDGYEQPARVRGEVLLGHDAYELDGFGWRSHRGVAALSHQRRRHGLVNPAGVAPEGPAPYVVWSTAEEVEGAGDDVWGQSLTVTPAGTLRTGMWRIEGGGAGFAEAWQPVP